MAAEQLPPPYVSIGIFNGTVETLAASTVPSGPLDRRVLDGLSGADYGALISALKFLRLVTEDRKATAQYRALVDSYKAGGQAYMSALVEVVNSAYHPLVKDVDILHGTISQLEKAFKDWGVPPGQMLTKSVRFYLKALQQSGAEVSPHITKASKTPRASTQPKKNGGDKPQPRKKAKRENELEREPKPVTPDGFERLPIPGVANAFIQYPSALTDANCDLFEAMIGVLRTYAKSRAGKERKP